MRRHPRILIHQSRIKDGGLIKLDPRESRYLFNVLRLGGGDRVVVFDGVSGRYAGEIVESAGRGEIELTRRAPDGGRLPPLTLFQAMIKGTRMDWLLEKAVEIGVTSFVPVITSRSVVRAGPEKLERWNRLASKAASQSGRISVPDIKPPIPLRDALGSAALKGLKLMFMEGAAPIATRVKELAGALLVSVLVGPEGGLEPSEQEEALKAGFIAVSLPFNTYRSETAAISALAICQALRNAECGVRSAE